MSVYYYAHIPSVQVLLRLGHGRAVDWWSLGALLYEMISGLPPFYSRNREAMFEMIMNAQLTFPSYMNELSKDILSKLLVRDPKMRLGSGIFPISLAL